MTEMTHIVERTPVFRRTASSDTRRPSRRRLVFAVVIIAVVALAVAAGVLISRRPAAKPATQISPALTVTTAVPHRADWAATLAASGAIAPWQEASIGTQIGSYRLVDVRVNVGDRVRKGQVLARLNSALLRAEEAQLVASAQQADANRTRALGLQSSGGISDQDVLQFVTTAKTAAAQLASKRLQLRYTNVVAPDSGSISARTATLGAVEPTGQELFRLIRQDRLEWRGELTAVQLASVRAGQTICLALPDNSSASAVVRQTAPSLDNQSRLGILYADIRPGSRARAGMYAKGEITVGASSALVIPAESVVVRDGRSYVLKLADGKATPRVALQAVVVGRRTARESEILSGLDGGERLVVQGAGFLNDGDVVRIAPDQATRKAGAGS